MSEPNRWRLGCDVPALVMQELISAQSALNMEPERRQIPLITRVRDNPRFLSETDKWAHHAYAHIDAALDMLIAEQHCKASTDAGSASIFVKGCVCSWCRMQGVTK